MDLDGNDRKSHFANSGYVFVGIAVDQDFIYLTSNKHRYITFLNPVKFIYVRKCVLE